MLRCLACILSMLLSCIPVAAEDSMEYEALYFELLNRTAGPEYDAEFAQLPEAVQNLYLAAIFDMEIMNGGLVQYLVNCGPESASQVSKSLCAIGLEPMAALYDEFLATHEIDPGDLSGFKCKSVEDFTSLYKRYPESDDFDNTYVELWQALDFNTAMLAYAEENLR